MNSWWLVLPVLALVCAAAGLWLHRQGRLRVLPQPRSTVAGQAASAASQAIPPIVWTYWHTSELPLVVARCIAGWQRLNPGYRIEVLQPGRLGEFLDDVPPGLARLNIAKQTDWIRLALLQRHGGIWMDASIILTQPLDWVETARAVARAEFVGFYLDGYTTRPDYPVVESWFLAAVPGSAFIGAWLAQFRREAVDGETSGYLARLRAQGRYAEVTQQIGDPAYHTIHVVAQDVLQSAALVDQPWRLHLLCAEDTAYWLHRQSAWKRRALFVRLLWARGDARHWPALVKLRGGERRKLEWWLRRGWFTRHSLVAHSLGGVGPQADFDTAAAERDVP